MDLESKEHLWYIDATDPKKGNWMRYINCARFFEEQNIISQQEGTEIFYKAIKVRKVCIYLPNAVLHLGATLQIMNF